MSMSFKASPDGTYGEILVNGQVVAKLPVTGNAVIPNLVGTVSESGGVPTGAIIERGSNVNGNYIRYADGTQICWHVDSTPYTVDTQFGSSPFYFVAGPVLTFPAAFSAAPEIARRFVRQGGTTCHWAAGAGPSATTTGSATLWAGSGGSGLFAYLAIGRWF